MIELCCEYLSVRCINAINLDDAVKENIKEHNPN